MLVLKMNIGHLKKIAGNGAIKEISSIIDKTKRNKIVFCLERNADLDQISENLDKINNIIC